VASFYNIGDRKTNIIYTKLKHRGSGLNADLYRVNLKNDPRCVCGHLFEDAIHFFSWMSTSWIVKWYGKCGRKVSWIVKRFRKFRRKVSWIVKRFGKYRRKLWNDMENMDEMWNDMENMKEK
jgi:hypothetical protein